MKIFKNADEADESEYVSLETEIFGRNTFIFSPDDNTQKIDELLKNLFDQQNDYTNDAQFKGKQYQVYFKKRRLYRYIMYVFRFLYNIKWFREIAYRC